MGKLVGRLSGAAVLGFAIYGGYTYFEQGYHTRPEIPAGAISFSFNSGLRAIALDMSAERETRRYLGVPFDVPPEVEDAWSICRAPDEAVAAEVVKQFDMGPQSRLDAVCIVETGDTVIRRGAIFSVPRN